MVVLIVYKQERYNFLGTNTPGVSPVKQKKNDHDDTDVENI